MPDSNEQSISEEGSERTLDVVPTTDLGSGVFWTLDSEAHHLVIYDAITERRISNLDSAAMGYMSSGLKEDKGGDNFIALSLVFNDPSGKKIRFKGSVLSLTYVPNKEFEGGGGGGGSGDEGGEGEEDAATNEGEQTPDAEHEGDDPAQPESDASASKPSAASDQSSGVSEASGPSGEDEAGGQEGTGDAEPSEQPSDDVQPVSEQPQGQGSAGGGRGGSYTKGDVETDRRRLSWIQEHNA